MVERLTRCRRRRDFLKIDCTPNPRHLDEFVKKHPVRRIFPNLETELYDMLVKCAPLFENFEE